ncbi:MAG: hypothetical protein JWN27_1340 [Candidatus Eremiobacteraeota bacterium]|nr:hypothetical protein [Candidatus Eremiobacteraeota bacterium]
MRRTRISVSLLALVVAAAAGGPAAPASGAALGALEFDEIDHVYTTEAVPPPGTFRQDAGLVSAQAAAPAPTQEPPRRNSSIFGALSTVSTVLGNASSVVTSSGELGHALNIADGVARLAPLTTAMGMAGGRQFGALLQTYVLPRVSPTGAVMLQGFLSAQAEYKAHFGSRGPSAQAPPPQQLAPYAKGTIRHYTVAANGWVRVDDPNTKMALIIKPDIGKTYVVDAGSQTVHVGSYDRASATSGAPSGSAGTATVDDRVEQLGPTTLDGIPAAGFRTRSTMNVAGAGGTCPDATIVSTRIEYFSGYQIGAGTANTSPLAPTGDSSGCDPTSSVKHAGSHVPADRLLMYQANTVEKKTAAGTDKYTVVIERGNLQEQSTADPSAFEVPAGFRRV